MKTTRLTLRLGVWMLSCLATTIVTAPAAGSSLSCYFPVFGSDVGEFIGLSLLNTAAATNEVTVTWTNGDGNSSRSGRVSLAPGAQHASLLREFLGTPDDPRDGGRVLSGLAAPASGGGGRTAFRGARPGLAHPGRRGPG